MRLYGIPSEDRVLEIIESMRGEDWIFIDNSNREELRLSLEGAKEKMKNIVNEVKSWKTSNRHIPTYTPLIFIHEPDNPRVFKVYDLSSLGCGTFLTPPRWILHLKDVELQNS